MMKKSEKKRKKIVILAILLIMIGIAFFVYEKIGKRQETDENKVAVQAVSILTGAQNTSQNRFSGMVISQKTIKLQKEENRTVKKVYVEVGQAVKTGDKLFEYDTEDINAKIEQENLEVEKMQNSISNSKKQIETIHAEKNANPEADHASYNIEIQTLQNEIKQTEYNIKSKKSEIERLKKRLQNVVITSEIDGIVQSINDSENGTESISDGSQQDGSYMSIMQTGQYRVKGTVNEQNMFSINVGDKVILHSRLDETVTWTGTIESIDTSNPENNNSNGYVMMGEDNTNKSSKYPFYVTLDSMEGLMMGQHVYIEKNVGQNVPREGLWLSSYYVIEENGKYFVWAVDSKEKLEKRKIEIGEKEEEMGEFQILSGLTIEDYIAIPEEGLQEGASVNKFDDVEILPDMDFSIDEMLPNEGEILESVEPRIEEMIQQ